MDWLDKSDSPKKPAAGRCSNAEALDLLDNLVAWSLVVMDYAAIRAAAELAERAQLSFWDALNDQQLILGLRVSNPFAADRIRQAAVPVDSEVGLSYSTRNAIDGSILAALRAGR